MLISEKNKPDIDSARTEALANNEKLARLLPLELQQRENDLSLLFSRHKGNVLNKLHDLYAFMDELVPYVNEVTPCKRGCNHCCHFPVSVSALEVEYMKNRNRKLRSKMGPAIPETGSPCPFLSQGVCSIYAVRPFFCRKHVALTSTAFWCHPDRCQSILLPQLLFTEVFKVYEQILMESGVFPKIYDIRDIALIM